MNKVKNMVIDGEHGRPILMDLYYKENLAKKPIVVFCHGYKGFKDWGCWDLVAEKFAESDFFFVKFNFSHNGGTVEQPIDFPDLDAFGQNNYIKELDDLQSVLDWITKGSNVYQEHIDTSKIVLIGHSRGGGIVTLKTAEDPRIQKLITWAGVSDFESRFPNGEALELWKKEGVMYVQNGRTKQQMPHQFQFYTSFIQNKERLTISEAAKKLSVPFLIIHGTGDPTVSVNEAKNLHQWGDGSELFLIQEADHVFGGRHPWQLNSLPQHLETVVTKSISFAIL